MPSRPACLVLFAVLAALALPAGAQAHGPGSKAPNHIDTPADIHVDLAKQVRLARLAGVRAITVSGSQQFLPTTWCGDERTTDDLANAAQLSDEPVYKVVYAYASDQLDRFNLWKNQLQANVSLIGQFMALQEGATRSPRFDMGTSCGPRYVDIQTVALPGTKSFYNDNFARITTAVGAALGGTPVKRNVVILADQLTTNPSNSLYGLGQHYTGSSAELSGAANIHNSGNLYAALFPPVGYAPPTVSGQQFYPGFWPEGMLHEITHTLGAVNSSAPHATTAGHCTDGYDVMCYSDGGMQSTPYSTTACPQIAGSAGMTQTYDCGGDDYFNPSPAPGSYLATHWNLYDNVFESQCATIGFACGADSAALPAGVSVPRVTGTRKVTNTLTADNGTWSGTPTSFTYHWQRSTGANPFADIDGATAATYTLVPDDATAQVRVTVTATNANGSASTTSAASAIPAFNPPVNTTPPSIAGTAQRLSVLTATSGTWTNSTSQSRKWQRLVNGTWTDIAGQTATTYTLASGDVGTSVRVLETATNADGPASVASNEIGPVAGAPPVLQAAPVVSGTPKRTRTLTASTGSWTNAPSAYGYRWQRDTGGGFQDIGLATQQTYVPGADDLGATLRVMVTASNGDGDSIAAPSNPVGPVINLQPPVASADPAIAGLAKRGHTLSADHGTWTNAPTDYAYQWQRDEGSGFGDVQDATQDTYDLGVGDVGATLRVRVIATNGDGDGAAAYSQPSDPVEDALVPVNTTVPSILGTAQAGHTLTATNGSWANGPTAYARQWQRGTGGVFFDIDGATGSSYGPGAADVGHPVRVAVVASNAEGDSQPMVSSATGAVAAADLQPVVIPPDLGGQIATAPDQVVLTPPADVFKSVKVSLRRRKRVALKLTVTSRTTRLGLVATIPSKRVKVARRGTYRLTLCAGSVCITKPFRARHGKAKLPAIVASTRIPGPVTLKLIGPGGLATGRLP